MAFTPDEQLSIVEILGITPSFLDAHLTSLGAVHVTRVETRVRVQLNRWIDGAGSKFVKIWPKESNLGVETNSGDAKADIKRIVAILLELYDWAFSQATMGTLQVGR